MTELQQPQSIETPPNLLADLIKAIDAGDDLSGLINQSKSDIANVLESVNPPKRKAIIDVVPAEKYWPILHLLKYETAQHVHSLLNEAMLSERLAHISENDVINFADFLPVAFVDEFLLQQSDASAAYIQQALSYKDDTVGRYMESCYITANKRNTIGRIKGEMQRRSNSPVRLIVVRDGTEIVGCVSPEALLIASDSEVLSSILTPTPILEDTQNIYDVGKLVSIDGKSHWFPVLSGGKVVGVLPMSALAIALRELGLQAVVPENVKSEEDLFMPLGVAARLRGVWLVINLITAFAASAIIGVFDTVVEQVVALAILMPVVASMGGIAGSQTLAVSLRGIALNHLHQSNLKLLVNKELKIAAVNGLVMGAVIGGIVYWVFDSVGLGIIICCAISVNSLAAALSGTLIPFTLKKLNIDPAVAGSVVLTTVTDVVGFLVFLGLGALFLV